LARGAFLLCFGDPRPPTPWELQLAGFACQVARIAVERTRADEELRRRADALRDSDRRKDEFLATLAHELRNPLAPIRNAVQVSRSPQATDADLDVSRDIAERQVQIMTRLLDDLLDVSRISRGELHVRKELLSLDGVISSAVETTRPSIEAGRHQLDVELPAEPVQLYGDPVRLAQIFSNLLNNAAKFTPEGGHIRLVAVRDRETAVVSVHDDGIGIDPSIRPHLFEMFSQAVQGFDRPQAGLGIGLSLVRTLVDLHGGTVECSSAGPGKGSTFTVRLPIAHARAGRPEAGREPAPGPTDRKKRVLVVDDLPDGADSMAMMLRLSGHAVRVAYDGETALAAAAAWRPSVVLLDIGMPGMSGYEVCQQLRETPWGRDLKIVALTGWSQDDDRRRSRDAGFDHHLIKPVEPRALHELLEALPGPSDG
jgi:signal transduction histidine kinase/CheY-like chemotaxis protein